MRINVYASPILPYQDEGICRYLQYPFGVLCIVQCSIHHVHSLDLKEKFCQSYEFIVNYHRTVPNILQNLYLSASVVISSRFLRSFGFLPGSRPSLSAQISYSFPYIYVHKQEVVGDEGEFIL